MTFEERYMKTFPDTMSIEKTSAVPKVFLGFSGDGYFLCDVYKVIKKDGSTKEEYVKRQQRI